jgi:hypothetical protein
MTVTRAGDHVGTRLIVAQGRVAQRPFETFPGDLDGEYALLAGLCGPAGPVHHPQRRAPRAGASARPRARQHRPGATAPPAALRRYGPVATYDAVLTGFLLCGHLWTDQPGEWPEVWQRWTRRAEILIPPGAESSQFSAARIFAAAYPEAVTLASLIASPAWRGLAVGDPGQQQQFTAAIRQRLGWPGYQPADTGDAIAS